jgi:hypothetical protein
VRFVVLAPATRVLTFLAMLSLMMGAVGMASVGVTCRYLTRFTRFGDLAFDCVGLRSPASLVSASVVRFRTRSTNVCSAAAGHPSIASATAAAAASTPTAPTAAPLAALASLIRAGLSGTWCARGAARESRRFIHIGADISVTDVVGAVAVSAMAVGCAALAFGAVALGIAVAL